MYYAYLRRLDEVEGHYIGYGFKVDGLLFRDLSPLFDLFGSTFENMVIADRLLTLNVRGHIVANVGLLLEKRPEVERVINNLCTLLHELSTQFIPLQKVIFDHLSTQVWTFGEDADPSDIRKASQMSGYTIVQKGRMQVSVDSSLSIESDVKKESIGVEPISSDHKVVENLHQNDFVASTETDSVKQKDVAPTKPIKKSGWDGMKTFLLTMLLFAIGGLAYTITQLMSANQMESSAKSSYNMVKMTNAELNSKISSLQAQLEETNLKSREMEKRLIRQDSIITALRKYYKCNQPFVATSIYLTREGVQGYSSATIGNHVRGSNDLKLQPHVRYVGLENARTRLTVRWYKPRRFSFFDFGDLGFGTKSHDNSLTFDIETGEHQLDFDVWSGESHNRWEPGKYMVELWAGNECLQRKEFWVD